MQIKAFAASYAWIKEKKEWLYAELNKLPAWQAARRSVAELKRFIKENFHSLKTSGVIARIKEMKLRMKR